MIVQVPANMSTASDMAATFQAETSLLNESAPDNIPVKSTTLLTSHEETSLLKAAASVKAARRRKM